VSCGEPEQATRSFALDGRGLAAATTIANPTTLATLRAYMKRALPRECRPAFAGAVELHPICFRNKPELLSLLNARRSVSPTGKRKRRTSARAQDAPRRFVHALDVIGWKIVPQRVTPGLPDMPRLSVPLGSRRKNWPSWIDDGREKPSPKLQLLDGGKDDDGEQDDR
jgi:hypothetical protein